MTEEERQANGQACLDIFGMEGFEEWLALPDDHEWIVANDVFVLPVPRFPLMMLKDVGIVRVHFFGDSNAPEWEQLATAEEVQEYVAHGIQMRHRDVKLDLDNVVRQPGEPMP